MNIGADDPDSSSPSPPAPAPALTTTAPVACAVVPENASVQSDRLGSSPSGSDKKHVQGNDELHYLRDVADLSDVCAHVAANDSGLEMIECVQTAGMLMVALTTFFLATTV
eukprot:m.133625 g.133625  ORF g.133625 m.133625 type:complete len:111 (+) comp9506_c0_seq6:1934-2266(+)